MRIVLVTPYLPASRNGNAHTTVRWRRFLRAAGHRVDLCTAWEGQPADVLIALHARRSHAAVRAWAEARPGAPLTLVLTGTDLYRDIRTDAQAKWSLTAASRLVVLQERGVEELPPALRGKAVVIHQSAPVLTSSRRPARHFDVAVVAHLRDEKDPFLAAEAARLLPPQSRVRVRHVGGELQPGLAAQAAAWAADLPRWRWLGPLPHGATRRRIADSHLLVISSRMEGGANVIVEAVTAGTPVLASRIPGNAGMLGADYAGYFPAGDAAALAVLLRRAETDPAYYLLLQTQCAARAPLFTPEREAAGVRALLEMPR